MLTEHDPSEAQGEVLSLFQLLWFQAVLSFLMAGEPLSPPAGGLIHWVLPFHVLMKTPSEIYCPSCVRMISAQQSLPNLTFRLFTSKVTNDILRRHEFEPKGILHLTVPCKPHNFFRLN